MIELAGCIIKDEQGGVLLLHRNTDKYQHWEIPGGKVEPGEKTEDAAAREIKEELDVDVIIERKIGEGIFPVGEETAHSIWYLARITDGNARIAEPQTFDGLRYFSAKEMAENHDILSQSAQKYLSIIKE